MDWNWFFSSVAQSMAALAGIIAAFVITSLVGNQSTYATRIARIRDLIARGQELVDRLEARHFRWYNENENETSLQSVESAADSPNAPEVPRHYYHEYRFSPFVPRAAVLKSIEVHMRRGKRGSGPSRYDPMTSSMQISRSVSNAQLYPKLEAERERIDTLIVEVRHHVRLVEQTRHAVSGNPENSTLVRRSLVTVLVLFYAGVIYPLSFLPLRSGPAPQLSLSAFIPALLSLRGGILALSSGIFTGMCIVLLRLSAALRYPEDLLSQLEGFSSVDLYSPYLRTMQQNEAEEAAESERSRGPNATQAEA
jgi:hypothetical protein